MTPEAGQWAVVCAKADPRRSAMEVSIQTRGVGEARWFDPADLHELDRIVRRGNVHAVLFPAPGDLLKGMWAEEIELAEWPAQVQIEFLENPQGKALAESTWSGWQQWRGAHRRRQAIAGLVLSAVVLALSFILCVWLAR